VLVLYGCCAGPGGVEGSLPYSCLGGSYLKESSLLCDDCVALLCESLLEKLDMKDRTVIVMSSDTIDFKTSAYLYYDYPS
jgi:hypothetical protein